MVERGTRTPGSSAAGRLGAAFGLAAVWIALWGSVSWATVLGGLLVGAVLATAVRQPAMPLGVGRRPGRLLVALGITAVDVARSTVAVAWAAIRTGPRTRSELIRIQAPVCRPEVLVLTASLITLSPGTVVVEIDPRRSELLVHVLPVHDSRHARADVQRTTERLVRALDGGELR